MCLCDRETLRQRQSRKFWTVSRQKYPACSWEAGSLPTWFRPLSGNVRHIWSVICPASHLRVFPWVFSSVMCDRYQLPPCRSVIYFLTVRLSLDSSSIFSYTYIFYIRSHFHQHRLMHWLFLKDTWNQALIVWRQYCSPPWCVLMLWYTLMCSGVAVHPDVFWCCGTP